MRAKQLLPSALTGRHRHEPGAATLLAASLLLHPFRRSAMCAYGRCDAVVASVQNGTDWLA